MNEIKKVRIINKPIVRWILFLPGAILGYVIIGFTWGALCLISVGRYSSIDGFFFKIYEGITSGFLVGFVFVYVGVYIVPIKKILISKLLVFIIVLFSILVISLPLILFESTMDDYVQALLYAFQVLGAFRAYFYIRNKQLNLI